MQTMSDLQRRALFVQANQQGIRRGAIAVLQRENAGAPQLAQQWHAEVARAVTRQLLRRGGLAGVKPIFRADGQLPQGSQFAPGQIDITG